MRSYRWQATDESVEALRKLRGAWTSYVVGVYAFTVQLADGDFVRVEMEPVDVEGVFDAYRVSASINPVPRPIEELDGDTEKDWPTGPLRDPNTLAGGGNDVVLFSGASWSEPTDPGIIKEFGPGAAFTLSGSASHVSDTAEIVCYTTDSFVVASSSGEGILVRSGLKPESVEFVDDPETVRKFLLDRGYSNEAQ